MPVGPLKDGMPNSISSTVGGKPNKLLRQDMQSQKLVLGSDKDLLKETGGKEAQKPSKYPTPFRAQNHRRVKATMKGLKKKSSRFCQENRHGIVAGHRFYKNRGTVKIPAGCISICRCRYVCSRYVDIWLCVCACVYLYMFLCVHVYMYVCKCAYVYVCIYVCV